MNLDRRINPGLETLIEFGVVKPQRPSRVREQVIDCIGCHVLHDAQQDPWFYANQIATCQIVSRQAVRTVFKRLRNARVITEAEPQKLNSSEAHHFKIADTAVGEAFRSTVQPPENCPTQRTKGES